MKQSLIRYKAKPESVEKNERLIKDVFKELHAKSPDGIRYLSLKLGDGTFVHFIVSEANALSMPEFEAFRAFQNGIKDRCVEPPQAGDVTIVGDYRMLGPR